MTPVDAAGTPIAVGDIVRQANVDGSRWWDGRKGAQLGNAGAIGVVTKTGHRRVHVDFGRTKRDRWGTIATDEPVTDYVDGSMLTILDDPKGGCYERADADHDPGATRARLNMTLAHMPREATT